MEAESLESAVARRVRELRSAAGVSQDQFARACARAGLGWRASRVGQLETARVTVTPGVLLGLARAFTEVAGRDIRISDLIPADASLHLGESLFASGQQLVDALAGRSSPAVKGLVDIDSVSNPRLKPEWGIVEDRVAEVVPNCERIVLEVALRLYGHGGTQERDERAGVGASKQKRGSATRAIVAELAEAVEREIDEVAARDAAFEEAVSRGEVEWDGRS